MAGTLPSGTSYPTGIDGVANGYGAVAASQVITASYANDQTSAILALENTVGIAPTAGTPYSTVGSAIQGLFAGAPGGGSGSLFLVQNFT